MQEPASNLVPAAELQSADVILLPPYTRAREEALEESLPPPHRDGDGGDGDGGGTSLPQVVAADSEQTSPEDTRPASDAEITSAVLSLRGAHTRSAAVLRPYAAQLPHAVFVAILEEVRENDAAGNVTNPVGLLKWRLEGEIEARTQRAMTEVAGAASARFGYGERSPSEQLRNDPQRYIETLASELTAAEVDRYLCAHVVDDLERRRLRLRATELRTAT
jgi:hypothetical protein